MKKLIILIIVVLVLFGGLIWGVIERGDNGFKNPQGEKLVIEKPYDKYSFERLVSREDKSSQIEIGRVLVEQPEFTSYVFSYVSEERRISGQLNLPNLSRLMGVVVMARGYVEKDGYTIGTGTRNAAAVYAKNGYITIAPDFSGYGESDPEDPNALGARLVKPVEILDLLSSISSLPQADLNKVFLWGHSNGGQIVLSVGEVLGERSRRGMQATTAKVLGATLWAPVSKPFPYNILYYTDEAEDQGKWLRAEIARFESEYDVYNYSIDRYLDWIQIPLLIHQGTLDEPVPVAWSRELEDRLKVKGKSYKYYEYLGADHNMRPSWNVVVSRDIDWFKNLLEE